MANDPSTQSDPNAPPTGTPQDPLSVSIAPPVAGGVVVPTDGMDETREGGAYRLPDGVDGNGKPQFRYVDAEGNPIKAPKGSA
jgi:hypothetical protein